MNRTRTTADNRQELDPRIVIGLFISGALWISSCRSIPGALVWVIITLVCAAALRRGAPYGTHSGPGVIRWVIPMALLVALMYALFQPGDGPPLASLGPIRISQDGLATGARLGLRLTAFAGLAAGVAILANPSAMAAGVTRLLLLMRTIGLPVASLYYLMFFMLRMYPLLDEELQVIRLGQQARGVRFDGAWRTRIRMSAALIVPAFGAALRRADRLSAALASRGFDVRRVPARVLSLRFAGRDWIAALLLTAGWVLWLTARLQPVDLWSF